MCLQCCCGREERPGVAVINHSLVPPPPYHTQAQTHTHTQALYWHHYMGPPFTNSANTHSPSLSHTHTHTYVDPFSPPPTLFTAWGGEILLPYEEEEHIINYTHILLYTHKHVYMPGSIATHIDSLRSQLLILAQNSKISCIMLKYFCIFHLSAAP